MPTYKYIAKNLDAHSVAGKMVADNQSVVIDELRKRKLTIISVTEVKESSFKISFQSKRSSRKSWSFFRVSWRR